VTTDVGGAGEAIIEDRTGFLAPNDDTDAIATLACRILADQDLRARAAVAGPAFVRHRFNTERMLDETIALYALSGANGRPHIRCISL
jgi:glycosyltransferase involved in cell wall biosynthesis